MSQLAYDRSMRSKDADGRLHVRQCNIGKATVSPYFGREIPGYKSLGLHPDKIYHLYRHPDELRKSVNTFDNMPLLVKHVPVSAETPEQELTVGTTGSECVYEHPYLKNSLAVWTQEAIDLVESGEQEQLSPAYRYTPDMTPGTSHDGLRYDGVMRNIIGNHVAIVETGRQGPDVVVADANPVELPEMRFNFLKTFVALFAPAATPEQVLALDAALAADLAQDGLSDEEKAAACDAMAKELNKACDALTEAEREDAYKRAAKDKAKPAQDEKTVTAAELAAAVATAKAEGIAEGQAAAKLAQDEALAAAKLAQDEALATAKAQADALTAARAEVAPVCGDVTCDSADGVYEFALKHLQIDIAGVHASAYPALFRVASKAAAAPARPAPAIAADAALAFPILTTIRRG